MQIVFLSHTAMGGPFVVGSHHLARAFHALGHQVTHVSAPVSPGHLVAALGDRFIRSRVSRWWQGGVLVDGVRELIPFTWLPWRVARMGKPLWLAYSRAVLDLHDAQCLIVDEPRFAGLVSKASCSVIYRATDLYAELRHDPKVIDTERVLCERAQVVVATSEPVARHLRMLSGKPVSVITNGVDFERFAEPAAACEEWSLPGSREQRATYVGAFDFRFSRSALEKAARSLPDKYFLLAGPGSRAFARSLALRNVLGLGTITYSKVASLLQQCSVGLLPLAAGPANEGRSPMKLYEYAAAGMTIAALATTELMRRSLPTLCTCLTEDDYPHVVGKAFELCANAASVDEAREQARLHGWPAKAKALLSLIEAFQAVPTLSGCPPVSRSVMP